MHWILLYMTPCWSLLRSAFDAERLTDTEVPLFKHHDCDFLVLVS